MGENWICNKQSVSDNDRKQLEKGKRIEKQKNQKGYRWIDVYSGCRVFVMCNKNGEPTEESKKKILSLKKRFGLK